MSILGNILNIVEAIIGFSVLILVHELGHFLAAKWIGVRVEAFSLGFGPYIGRRWRGTEYRLGLVSLGGYVKLAGGEEREAGRTPAPDEFLAQTPGRRALVYATGPLMNLALAFIAFIVAFQMGVHVTPARAGGVVPGSPAWRAGILRGDEIVSINDLATGIDFEDLSMAAALGRPDEPVRLGVRRGGRRFEVAVTPRYVPERGVQSIGIERPIELRVSEFLKLNGREPAREAGLREGDLIVGAAVDSPEAEAGGPPPVTDPREVSRIVRESGGRPVVVRYRRRENGGEMTGVARIQPARADARMGWLLGVELRSNVVADVRPGSWLHAAGLAAGDRITAVGDAADIVRGDQIERAFATATGASVEVAFDRPGKTGLRRARVEVPSDLDLEAVLMLEPSNVVDSLTPGFPAEALGIRPGDRIMRVGDKDIHSDEDLWQALNASRGRPLAIRWVRDSQPMSSTFAPERSWFIGVQWTMVEEPLPLGPWRACVHGARKTAQWIRRFFSTLVGFVTQRVASRHLGGAITIGQVTYAAARYGVPKLIYFIGLISINLGLINLVPIPILDGGHLLFIGIEKARGRPVNDRIQSVATYMGMAIILSLILFSTWNDLWRLFGSG